MGKKILIIIAVFLTEYTAFGCMCYPPKIEQEWSYSSHIFTGKIISIQQYPSIFMVNGNNTKEYLLIEIQQSFKGFYKTPKYITLIKVNDSCARSYIENKTYIFYCSTFMGTEIMYAPDSCSRTMSSDNLGFKNEILTLINLKKNNSPPVNSQSLRSIETKELNKLREDASQSRQLSQKNKIQSVVMICLGFIISILLLLLFKKFKKNRN